MADKRHSTGRRGEEEAARYLRHQGYEVVARNYRYGRAEIDLVCRKAQSGEARGGEIVFVEVKTRRSAAFGTPEEAIGPAQRRNLLKAAEAYLDAHDCEDLLPRFDVVSIEIRGGVTRLRHVEDAIWFDF